LKKDLKSAHNYIREFLNQRLKSDKKKKGDGDDYEIRNKKSKIEPIETAILPSMQQSSEYIEPPKSKTIIRRYH
jgi:hypothetical protein